jgi:hypothetical protein
MQTNSIDPMRDGKAVMLPPDLQIVSAHNEMLPALLPPALFRAVQLGRRSFQC